MEILGDLDSENDLIGTRRIGMDTQESTGFNGFQNQLPSQPTIFQTLFVWITWQDSHLKKVAFYQFGAMGDFWKSLVFWGAAVVGPGERVRLGRSGTRPRGAVWKEMQPQAGRVFLLRARGAP